MELIEVIAQRRSVRNYTGQKVEKHTIEQLIHDATLAPSAMNSQPWAYAVIQDDAMLKTLSDESKAFLLSVMDEYPQLSKYRTALTNPDFNIFYNAGNLIIIYAKPQGPHPEEDCCLAAQNLMLSACNLGLGTCWIGFSRPLLNKAEVKERLGVPAEYSAVAPLIVGYPQGNFPSIPRQDAEIVFWK